MFIGAGRDASVLIRSRPLKPVKHHAILVGSLRKFGHNQPCVDQLVDIDLNRPPDWSEMRSCVVEMIPG